MGLSSIGSFILMFFVMIIMVSSIFVVYSTLIQNSAAITEQQKTNQEISKTSIRIYNITYDRLAGKDRTMIEIINTGSTKIDVDKIDVFIDDVYIPRNTNNRTMRFNGTNNLNPLHFDPGEFLEINVSLDRNDGTHQVVVSTDLGVSASGQFTYNS